MVPIETPRGSERAVTQNKTRTRALAIAETCDYSIVIAIKLLMLLPTFKGFGNRRRESMATHEPSITSLSRHDGCTGIKIYTLESQKHDKLGEV